MNTDSIHQPSAAEKMKVMETHLHILRRAGRVLIVFGIIALAAELDTLIRAPMGFVHLNITWLPFLVAGLLLVRENLRAAALCSWLSSLLLPICAACAALQWLLPPFDLTLLQFRLSPASVLQALFWQVGTIVSLTWVLRELGRQPVLFARAQSGLRNYNPRLPLLLGVTFSIVACIFVSWGIYGDSARRAKAVAAQKLGPNYKCWVKFVNFGVGPVGKSISALVIAYNHDELRGVQVQWTEDSHGRASQPIVGLPNPELRLSGPEVWTVDGTTYRVESTTLVTCGNGERLLTVSARVSFTPTSSHKPIAMLLAQYAVEHGYADRALRSWSNPPPQAQLAAVGVSLIDPRSTPGQLIGFRYNFGFSELANPVETAALGTR